MLDVVRLRRITFKESVLTCPRLLPDFSKVFQLTLPCCQYVPRMLSSTSSSSGRSSRDNQLGAVLDLREPGKQVSVPDGLEVPYHGLQVSRGEDPQPLVDQKPQPEKDIISVKPDYTKRSKWKPKNRNLSILACGIFIAIAIILGTVLGLQARKNGSE